MAVGMRRISGRLALLAVLAGAPGCYRVNTPGAATRSVPPPDAVLRSDAALPSVAALPADAVPRQEYKSRLGNPAFYDEFGVRYRVLQTSKDFVERGIASWYGSDFHGRRTSTGEPYDMYAMTAAHKTLPLPTYVRVTDLDTGNEVVVRVNDRGPFVEGRVIDLSYVAALKLGIARQGTARVEVRALDPPAVDPPEMGSPFSRTNRASRGASIPSHRLLTLSPSRYDRVSVAQAIPADPLPGPRW